MMNAASIMKESVLSLPPFKLLASTKHTLRQIR